MLGGRGNLPLTLIRYDSGGGGLRSPDRHDNERRRPCRNGAGELGEKVERIQEELERIGEHLARLRESWGDDGWVYDDDEEKEEPCAPATPC